MTSLKRSFYAFRRRWKLRFRLLTTIEKMHQRVEDLEIALAQLNSLAKMKNALPPIPPKRLQVRVSGAFYPEFFEHGVEMFHDLDRILHKDSRKLLDFKNILDFGCGCGRFLIPISLIGDPGRFSGTDIDRQPINWLKANYSCFRDLDVNGAVPPTKYGDGAFDFIFSVSIFTHLPEDMQHNWLKELSRILQPGGYGIFTTHGAHHFHHLNEPARAELLKKGFYYSVGHVTDGLPEFYQTSFHTHDYVRREWSRYFDVIAIQEQGMARGQDAILVKKR